jgi:hypothetical protein
MDIVKAIKQCAPGAKCTVLGNSYEGIDWLDANIAKPSEADLEAAYAIVLAQEAAVAYQSLRAEAYPALGEQLDMIWHAMDNNLIPMAREFYDARKAVKEQYPKP